MAKARERLENLFSRIITGTPGTVVMHSSLSNLLPPPQVEEELLAVVEEYVAAGWTWVFPSFTFSFCEGKPFNLAKSRSESGIVADLVLDRLAGAARTRHPVYSYVAVGPKAAELAALPATSCFGDDTPFGFFDRENAWQIMLGCGIEYFTQVHRYEELARVPYRTHRNFSGLADWNDGKGLVPCTIDMLVRDWKLGTNFSWRPFVERMRAERRILELSLWRGEVQAVRTDDLRQTVMGMLTADPLALIVNKEDVEGRLGARASIANRNGMGVALLGSANIHLLRRALEAELAAMVTNRDWRIYAPPFGQLGRELRVADSELARFKPDVAICCDRLEDIVGRIAVDVVDEAGREKILEAVREYADAVAGWIGRNGGWLIIHRFAPLDVGAALEAGDLFLRANAILDKRLAGLDRILWIDPAALAAAVGEKAVDDRLRYMGRFSLSERMSRVIAGRWAGYVAAMTGNTARAVVVDLDNTLWGGVLGEDGRDDLEVGGDYPGNAYREFQQALLRLKERGIVLAACSKNDEATALSAMETLPGMALRPRDLAAHRIGWRPKWEYVKEIAAALNLGLSSILFIDDNPVERDLIRQALPEVRVLNLPADPAEFRSALLVCPWLAALPATAEDLARSANMAGRAELEREKARSLDLGAFYASLGLKVTLSPLDEGNLVRAEQLCQKTNQFNTTGKRYSRRDLQNLAENGADVVVIALEDKYSALENIGLLILKPDGDVAGSVDLFLLSCRVLGRGIEVPLIRWAVSRAAMRGWERLDGELVETDRNAPVRGIFGDAGMRKMPDGGWSTRPENDYEPPPWLKMRDNVNSAPTCRRAKSRRMNKNRRIAEVCSQVLGVSGDELEAAAMDRTGGWDSMKHIELILTLEKEFELVIPSDGIMNLRTLADLEAAFTPRGVGQNV